MSVIRLLLIDKNHTLSGQIPSASIANILYAIAKGAQNIKEMWKIVSKTDPTLEEFYNSNLDKEPTLEGTGDGLLVINWQHKCIESFQIYQPLKLVNKIQIHSGKFCMISQESEIFYIDTNSWKLLDHYFDECRRKL